MQTMRAKFIVNNVEAAKDVNQVTTSETLHMSAVSDKPFDADGKSEDSDFARWSPSGSLTLQVANPALFGKLVVGEKYYLDFTKAE